jgi:hypothetical protein
VLFRKLKGIFPLRGYSVAVGGVGILEIYIKEQRAEMQTTKNEGFCAEGPETVGSEITQPLLRS